MNIIKKVINNVPVTILKTNKFKSVTGTLYFKMPAKREDLTYFKMLRNILLESCKKYDTQEKLSINVLENYDAYYGSSTSRYGIYLINSFTFANLEDKYTEEGNLKNIIDTFCEIIFNPLVKDGKFDEETFNILKKSYKNSLEKIKEDSGAYAERNILKNLNQNKAYTYITEIKYLEDMTPKSLYEKYLYMINNSQISLIVCGNVTEKEEFLDQITKNIKTNKKYDMPLIISNDDEKDELVTKIDKGYGTQDILMMVMYLKNCNNYELHYVAPIYRIILGGSESRLFNIIREKNSLAYYAFARLEKDDSLIEIMMGIEEKNYEKAKNLTFEVIESMNEITEEELESAKKVIITSLKDSQDNIVNITSRQHNSELFDLPDIETFIENIKKVTKKEVEDFAVKLKPNFCYFLKGDAIDE